MKKNGFTLVETMLAIFISTLAVFAVISTYTNGMILMKKSGKHLRAQQEAIVTMNQIGKMIRESSNLDIYNFTPPLSLSTSPSGNFLVAYSPYGETTAFYQIENKMFCVPNYSLSSFNTNLGIQLAKDTNGSTPFAIDGDSISLDFEIKDNDDANITLFSSKTLFTPRN